MEIEVSERFLAGALFALFSAVVLVLGIIVSPRVDGRPVLLSPGNMAVKRYLDEASRWNSTCVDVSSKLAELEGAEKSSVGDIYSANRELTAAMSDLEAVARDMDASKVPESMTGLHRLGMSTVKLELAWGHSVGAMLSAPTADNVRAAKRDGEAAKEALKLWSDTLRLQKRKLRGG